MKVGEAARRLGVPVHVLRHWDDAGVVVPDRTASGHREYSAEHLHRMRVLRACQGVGMSLSDIRLVLHRDEPERTAVIERQLRTIRERRAQLQNAERFLSHVIDCRHDMLTRCSECRTFGDTATPPTDGRGTGSPSV